MTDLSTLLGLGLGFVNQSLALYFSLQGDFQKSAHYGAAAAACYALEAALRAHQ